MLLLPALLVAVSVCSALSAAVEQVALTYGARDTEMVVTFAANTVDVSAEVLYGLDPKKLTRSVTASGSQYTLGNYTSPMLFKATMTGLEPGNTNYFYTVGSQALGYTEAKAFRSHPGVGVEDVSFEVFGDLGQTENSQTTLDELMKFQKAIQGKSGGIISMGDLSYANGDQPQWDTFGNFISAASSGVPLMTTLGNHEWFDGDGADTENHKLTAYLSRYPNPPVNHKRELYYSFDAGLAHWVMIAGYCQRMKSVLTQPCLAEGSPEMEWLTKDLAAVDRSKTPWVIAVFHQPYVNSNFKHNMKTEGAPMKKAVEDVLNKYQVDLVFSGHVHSYERSKQVYDYKLTPGAPYYITIGDGGNAEGLAEQWIEPQPEWSAYRQASYGFGELRVVNSTAMEWRWHQNQDLLPVIADSYTFTKDAQGQKSLRGSSISAAVDNQPSITGRPVFADSERGRRAAQFNAVQLRRYAEEQAAASH